MNRRLFLGSAIARAMPPFPRWTEDPFFAGEHAIFFGPLPSDLVWIAEFQERARHEMMAVCGLLPQRHDS